MSPPLGEEITARNAPGIPLPVLFGALALMLVVPSMVNVIRSAFAWEPAPAPQTVLDGRAVYITQSTGCDDTASSCAAAVRFDNTTYSLNGFAVARLGDPVAVDAAGDVVVREVPGFEAAHAWVAVDVHGTWQLARQEPAGNGSFPATLLCPSVVAEQQADCQAAGTRATG